MEKHENERFGFLLRQISLLNALKLTYVCGYRVETIF